MAPLLTINNLSISFRQDHQNFKALDNVSLTVNAGQVLAIVGESGSGKSVTAMSVLRLLPGHEAIYESGEILFSEDGKPGKDILKMSQHELIHLRGGNISMIFQEPMTSLNPVMKCGQQIMEAIKQHQTTNRAAAYEKTIQLLGKVQLPDPVSIANRYPHQLSGGQKQRVMIAMAMSCEPQLLIADEPTTALDVTVQKNILSLIKGLQQEKNMGVILITHDLALVSDIADQIAVMYRGKIVEYGECSEVLKTQAHPYTRALLACRPSVHSKGRPLPVVADFFTADDIIAAPGKKPAIEFNKEVSSGRQLSGTLITVQNLSVHFKQSGWFQKDKNIVKAVDDVSFTISQGETVGLFGESGSGKSTLGHALLGLIKPSAGNIFLGEKDVTALRRKEWRELRKSIQVVFQDPYSSLNPRLTIGNAIAEPLAVHYPEFSSADRKQKVQDLLRKVDLKKEHYNRYPHEFSGGQRQRIGIARALALNPYFIVFDESVSALDVSVQAQVLNLLNDLKKEFAFTSVFITHDLSVVHYISDRILVMHAGKIVESGAADEIFHSPKTSYTQKLLASIPGRKPGKT